MSTGARASELLSATLAGIDPGRQLITVMRKGTRELAELPASVDAFVWLYQLEMEGKLPRGGSRQPAGAYRSPPHGIVYTTRTRRRGFRIAVSDAVWGARVAEISSRQPSSSLPMS